ncbi:hypothetical protein GGE45_003960 [Rhizobium aethiopicum]|uniref:NAD/NADP octopine/nopaline dehydrogenase family protein n=1 Tax=Rhizobium aethiopicum TaxID=1138170 RepID=UPI00161C5644|nr:NAD/NADP octopine/nopaline dehydrogenase family protein [Rhizobium aethiopicum]MBB4581612.1 hypothetical protein [Rhizobium aethiopicum]
MNVTGEINHAVRPETTIDIADVHNTSDIIFVSLNTKAHREYFRVLYYFLTERAKTYPNLAKRLASQIIVFVPGGGATLRAYKKGMLPYAIVELGNAPYIANFPGQTGETAVLRIKNWLQAAAPLSKVPEVTRNIIQNILGLKAMEWTKQPATTVLGPNYFIHTAGTAPNLGRLSKADGKDAFYNDWVNTPAAKNIGNLLNEDFKALMKVLDLEVVGIIQLLARSYGVAANDLQELVDRVEGYQAVKSSPKDLLHRFFTEDIHGLRLFRDLLKRFSLSTKNPDTLINIFSMAHAIDYEAGPTLMEELGLADRSPAEIKLMLSDLDCFYDGRLDEMIAEGAAEVVTEEAEEDEAQAFSMARAGTFNI